MRTTPTRLYLCPLPLSHYLTMISGVCGPASATTPTTKATRVIIVGSRRNWQGLGAQVERAPQEPFFFSLSLPHEISFIKNTMMLHKLQLRKFGKPQLQKMEISWDYLVCFGNCLLNFRAFRQKCLRETQHNSLVLRLLIIWATGWGVQAIWNGSHCFSWCYIT